MQFQSLLKKFAHAPNPGPISDPNSIPNTSSTPESIIKVLKEYGRKKNTSLDLLYEVNPNPNPDPKINSNPKLNPVSGRRTE